jgi:hypothetical protein
MLSVFPECSFLGQLNSVEPPWYGPVCPVVWEGWRRETSPYPDRWHEAALSSGIETGLLFDTKLTAGEYRYDRARHLENKIAEAAAFRDRAVEEREKEPDGRRDRRPRRRASSLRMKASAD